MASDWNRRASLLGVAWIATLVVATVVSSSAPNSSASDATLLSWVSRHSSTAKAIGWITVVSVVVGICFFAVLRDYLERDRSVAGLASLAFGGAIVFSVGLLIELGLYLAAAKRISHLSVGAVEPIKVVVELGQLIQDAGIVVLTLAAGVAVLRSRRLPSWVGWSALVVALLALIPPIDPIGAFAFLVWTLAISITLYVRWRPGFTEGAAHISG